MNYGSLQGRGRSGSVRGESRVISEDPFHKGGALEGFARLSLRKLGGGYTAVKVEVLDLGDRRPHDGGKHFKGAN